MGVAVTELEVVIAVDIVVKTSKDLPVRRVKAVALILTRIVVVVLLHVITHHIHFLNGRTLVLTRDRIVLAQASQILLTRSVVHIILSVEEEEELVFDDRTTYGETNGVLEHVSIGEIGAVAVSEVAAELAALELVVLEVIVNGELPLVRTRLGSGLNSATHEARLTNVKRRDRDSHLIKSVERDRRTTSGEVRADTEAVVKRSTIHGNSRLTIVTTTYSETVRGNGSLRSERHHVVHRAVGGRGELNVGSRNRSKRTSTIRSHITQISCSNNDFLYAERFLLHFKIEVVFVGKVEVDTHHLEVLVTERLHFHIVGATRHNVAEVVITSAISSSVVHLTSGGVGSLYYSAYKRFRFVTDYTRQVGGCNLRVDSCTHKESCHQTENF